MKQITVPQIFNTKWKVEGLGFGSLFWEWDQIESTFWDYIHTPPLFLPIHWKKIVKLSGIKLSKIDFWNCFDSLEMCDKTQSVYCLSVPFRLIRSICFLSVKCESMYFMRKIKFMPCYWEFLFYQTCLGRSVCNRKIKLRNFLKVGAKKKRKFKKIHSELTKQRTHKTSPKNLVHFLAKTKILSWKHIYYYYPAPPISWLEGVAWTVKKKPYPENHWKSGQKLSKMAKP